ncbi:hypothetical protein ES703_73692 [subsurface metagenome]
MNWIQRFLAAITTHKEDASAHHAKTPTASGSYTGDDTVNRAIAHGLGVAPKLVVVMPDNVENAENRCGVILGGFDGNFGGLGDNCTDPDATSFYVSHNTFAQFNIQDVVYYWAAFG